MKLRYSSSTLVTLSFSSEIAMATLQSCLFPSLSLDGRKGGQASSEDLFPLGYGEWERVRVKPETIPLPLTPSRQGREETVINLLLFELQNAALHLTLFCEIRSVTYLCERTQVSGVEPFLPA